VGAPTLTPWRPGGRRPAAGRPEQPGPPGAGPQHPDRSRTVAFWAVAALLVAYYAGEVTPLGPDALTADLGIQYYLGAETARGAVPLLDFQHGWNVLSWYFNAGLYRLVDGDPTAWQYLWGVAFGPLLAGLAAAGTAWRLRFSPGWLLATVGGWVLLTNVVHWKYAIPALWMLALVPTGRPRREWTVLASRAGLAAVTFLAHFELGILLAVGVAMYDVFGDRMAPPRTRLLRASAAPAGVLIGFAGQAAVYAGLGLAPVALLTRLLGDSAQVYEQAQYGYPLFEPATFYAAVFPASLVASFVPAVWRRLAGHTRLVAFCHLALGLIAIRRTDFIHVEAAATLLGLLAVFAARDLLGAGRPNLSVPRSLLARPGLVLAGGVWLVTAVAAGFRIVSPLAIVALTLVVLTGPLIARWSEAGWFSVGALATAGLLVAVSLSGSVTAAVDAGQGGRRAEQIAAAAAGPVDECLGAGDQAWIVPSPLGLYEQLGVENPTRYTVFWYGFAGRAPEVIEAIEADEIPAIIKVSTWPGSFRERIVPEITENYRECAVVPVEATDDVVTVYTKR
jgi:hypothetical protein